MDKCLEDVGRKQGYFFDDDIVNYEAKELDEYLSRFLDEIRKSDGSDL